MSWGLGDRAQAAVGCHVLSQAVRCGVAELRGARRPGRVVGAQPLWGAPCACKRLGPPAPIVARPREAPTVLH